MFILAFSNSLSSRNSNIERPITSSSLSIPYTSSVEGEANNILPCKSVVIIASGEAISIEA